MNIFNYFCFIQILMLLISIKKECDCNNKFKNFHQCQENKCLIQLNIMEIGRYLNTVQPQENILRLNLYII